MTVFRGVDVPARSAPRVEGSIAISGATLIDGSGAPPIRDSVVLVRGSKIEHVGPRAAVKVPSDATVIDASGQFMTPGFVDTNVHIAPVSPVEYLVRYHDRLVEITVESAQEFLRHGVTTIRNSYGPLAPLLATRDAIDRGDVIGPRLYVCGNIVGWGAHGSMTYETWGHSYFNKSGPGLMNGSTTYLLEALQDEITQGAGEELILLGPTELAAAINVYLDKGIDFLKFGGTTHKVTPSLILFSPRQQEVIVQEGHRRGMVVETHSTSPEGLRISLLAGIDLVQHPELLDGVTMSDELVELHRTRNVICSMNIQYWTGQAWTDFMNERNEHERSRPDLGRAPTGSERRLASYWKSRESWRGNGEKLIAAGCRISTGSDTVTLPPQGLARGDESAYYRMIHSPGEGALRSIEGLVEMGMSPMEALVSATKHGAMASNALDEYGTISPGKSADLVLLRADPLDDIHNIRKLSMVMMRGQVIDTSALPTAPVFSAAPRLPRAG